MEHRNNNRNRNNNRRITLFAIMVGFCILAVIEIIYGQAQLKTERERLALEEENNRIMQALEAQELEQEKLRETTANKSDAVGSQDSVIINVAETTVQEPNINSADETGQVQAAAEEEEAEEKEYDMQIVFMGDSILDNTREYDGVAALISQNCNAKVYNLAIGGTTAALNVDEQYDFNNWTSISLLGMVNAILGNIDGSVFDNFKAGEILKKCDFSKTDYFVIEYGVNDFLSKIPISKYMENGDVLNIEANHTYAGALTAAVELLHNNFPDAKIILIAPHYCQYFSGKTFVGDAYSLDNGWGSLVAYSRVCSYVAEHAVDQNVLFYNAFEDSGIDAYTADQYLEDGIHLTAEGRHQYADYIIRMIKRDFYPVE